METKTYRRNLTISTILALGLLLIILGIIFKVYALSIIGFIGAASFALGLSSKIIINGEQITQTFIPKTTIDRSTIKSCQYKGFAALGGRNMRFSVFVLSKNNEVNIYDKIYISKRGYFPKARKELFSQLNNFVKNSNCEVDAKTSELLNKLVS